MPRNGELLLRRTFTILVDTFSARKHEDENSFKALLSLRTQLSPRERFTPLGTCNWPKLLNNVPNASFVGLIETVEYLKKTRLQEKFTNCCNKLIN